MCRLLPVTLATVITLWPGAAAADPVLSLDNLAMEQGETATLTLSASDLEPAWSGVNATIQLPEGVELVDAASSLEPTFDFDYHFDTANGQASFILFSASQTFGTSSVNVAELSVLATMDAVVGPNAVTFVEGLSGISNGTGSESVAHGTLDGLLNIELAALPIYALPFALVMLAACVFTMRRHRAVRAFSLS